MAELLDLYDEAGNLLSEKRFRGEPILSGEYLLVVTAFIRNHRGEFLISRRAHEKKGGGQLETVGGVATSGEDSETAILREIHEEVGLSIHPDEIKFLKRLSYITERSYHFDIWLVDKAFDLNDITPQVEEVSEVMFVSRADLVEMVKNNAFFNAHSYARVIEEALI